jgi:hypothetical protein
MHPHVVGIPPMQTAWPADAVRGPTNKAAKANRHIYCRYSCMRSHGKHFTRSLMDCAPGRTAGTLQLTLTVCMPPRQLREDQQPAHSYIRGAWQRCKGKHQGADTCIAVLPPDEAISGILRPWRCRRVLNRLTLAPSQVAPWDPCCQRHSCSVPPVTPAWTSTRSGGSLHGQSDEQIRYGLQVL